ncbi:MAG: protein kinase [Elusimicrobiota bacterium]
MRYLLPVSVAIHLLATHLHAAKPVTETLNTPSDSTTAGSVLPPVTNASPENAGDAATAGSILSDGLPEVKPGEEGGSVASVRSGSGFAGATLSAAKIAMDRARLDMDAANAKAKTMADKVSRDAQAINAKAIAAVAGLTKTPGQNAAGTATVFSPAATPEAEQDRQEVSRLVQSNDPAAAREYAVAALARNPTDPALMSYVKLTAPSKTAVDAKTVNKRAAELAEGMRQDDGSGEAMLATPISFGAFSGAASRGPAAAMPAGLGGSVPDLHGNAILRDASGKISIKDYAGAESALTRRIAEAPRDGGAFRLRSLTRRFLTRYADSADDARSALAIDPRDSRSLHLLSRDLTDLGRPKEALAEADRALALNNKDANAYIARSVALGALGRGEEELADLARAASLDSQFDALYHDTLTARNGGAKSARSWPVWIGAVGTALLFFSFALFRKRGDSSVRMALRKEDHEAFAAVAPRVDAVPKGFRVVKTLGQGGMGVVYEAVDLGLQRTVALKKLRAEISDNPRERTRFLKEARTVAALKHPNIVEIHAIHEDAEGLFIVFERVPGETLHERLGRGPVNHAEAAAILKQIASALDYAHSQGVVHQDLKPGNVMIHAGLAKVMDFGIARRVQETLSTMSKIEITGTPAYMSPEQEQGVVTPSADVYALGACAYESLTGTLPFPTGGIMLKAQKMYRKPSETTPGLRPEVDAAIGRALEPRPEDRWPSASSFVDALSRALA